MNEKIQKMKTIISNLPEMRWNISEKDENGFIYFGDELDNWIHMDKEELAEYFASIFSNVKELKDIIETL